MENMLAGMAQLGLETAEVSQSVFDSRMESYTPVAELD
jgi:hypothetical protein